MFGIDAVNTYYSNLNLRSKSFHLTLTSFEIVLILLQEIIPAKAAGIDKFGGRFLKDGAPVLANPIKNLCNLSIKLSKFHYGNKAYLPYFCLPAIFIWVGCVVGKSILCLYLLFSCCKFSSIIYIRQINLIYIYISVRNTPQGSSTFI